jgi:hypothetical protein
MALPALAAVRTSRAVVEFTPQPPGALAQFEIEIATTAETSAARLPVSDAALFVSKAGGDAAAALKIADRAALGPGEALFNVRLFVVAGGRLYTGVRGQCGAWENGLSLCSAACDGGIFAVRRTGSAPLELLLGAISGAPAGTGTGLTLSACGFDEEGDVRLVAKSGRGLAVAGFGSD